MNDILLFPKDNACLPDLIEKEEKEYEDQIAECVKIVLERNANLIFLAGPSCSGKTTTAQRLEETLMKEGKRVLAFSTDDFFFPQDRAPKNEDGTPNYDAFSHTDSDLIISVINDLSCGKKTDIPVFDFLKGARTGYKSVDPADYDIFLLEGIHALNDKILSSIGKNQPYVGFYLDVTRKVGMEKGEKHLLPEDVRFCRRMIRDFKHRGADVYLTWRLWKNVRRAEGEILHPYKKNAALVISTSFSYEVPVEKSEVAFLLEDVKEDSSLYPEAQRLLAVLDAFPVLPQSLVPERSVLREFID